MRLLFTFLAIFWLSMHSFSLAKVPLNKFKTIIYTVKKGDIFARIIWLYVKKDVHIYGNRTMIKLTKKLNPHVKDWNNLFPGTKIKLFINSHLANGAAVLAANKDEQNQQFSLSDDFKDKEWQFSTKLGLDMFYTVSSGSFVEKYENTTVSTAQKSPATLGVAGRFKLNDISSLSGSLYTSYIVRGVVANTQEVLSIPLEIGTNIYYNHRVSPTGFSVYGGFDLERFSTYNTDEFLQGNSLAVRTHLMTFATVGVSQPVKLFDRGFFIKASISKVVTSKSSPKSQISSNEYDGFKYIFYINTKITKRILAHFLWKQHILEGSTDLNVSRYGIGFGYKFF